MASTPVLRIGTRRSPLALAQTAEICAGLAAAHPDLAAPGAVETMVIKTTGDKIQDRPLAEAGGKGLFTKEIDEALLDGRIDLAVHSVKDVPTWLPEGLTMASMPERQDPRDVFVSPHAAGLDDLPAGSVVGTGSLRRRAQVLHRRPDLRVVPIRGNVETRLRKLDEGQVDAILLALAGLRRLSLADAATAVIEPEDILPAVGQGAIGIICRGADEATLARLRPLDHAATRVRVTAERAMLEVLDGSCRTPIAGLAEFTGGGDLLLRALVAWPDGSALFATSRRGPAADADAMGRDAGTELRRRAGPALFEESD